MIRIEAVHSPLHGDSSNQETSRSLLAALTCEAIRADDAFHLICDLSAFCTKPVASQQIRFQDIKQKLYERYF